MALGVRHTAIDASHDTAAVFTLPLTDISNQAEALGKLRCQAKSAIFT